MAKLRKFVAYRRLERPYTRKSKYRKLNYVRAAPHNKIARYEAGAVAKKFEYEIDLVAKDNLNIRHNAIESGRQSATKMLEKKLPKTEFFMKLKLFPHHVLRENPLASGAGADRMSTGMAGAFGKPIGIAARVKIGKAIVSIRVNETSLQVAKDALRRMYTKLPGSYQILVRKI